MAKHRTSLGGGKSELRTGRAASHRPVITLVPLDQSSTTALHEQIFIALRRIILTGKLAPGAKLPSTRMLSTELRVSRNTVLAAFEQLSSEGYVESRIGGGTYVASVPPDERLAARPDEGAKTATLRRSISLSGRGRDFETADVEWATHHRKQVAFKLGVPAVDVFPFALWEKLNNRVLRRRSPQMFGYGSPIGLGRLRSAVASYLVSARGVRCEPEQVLILEGAQVAIDLAMRVLLDRGDLAWMEEPGFPGARAAFQANGARIIPIPVDQDGLSLVAAGSVEPPRMIYVTPSHQFPLGVAMSASRRQELLRFAETNDTWIIEDDYLSEFRYSGRPVQALQGMDAGGRVIYVGSFSKTIFPALRLAYLVLPPDLVDVFTAARAATGLQASTPAQAVVADFISEGHFVRHLRRMRNLYLERQQVLLHAAKSELDGMLAVRPADAGMHLIGMLPPGIDDREVSSAAAAAGVECVPLSHCYLGGMSLHGLLLGYPGIRPPLIGRAIRDLSTVLGPLVDKAR